MRVLLVDDEPLARQRLRQMLADHADVAVVGEAEHVDQARELTRAERPDLILLDIRMPGVDGFALVESLHLTPMPYIIFVTAYAEHAVEAFDAAAVDYLLKPFDEERLARALERARAASRGAEPARHFAVAVGRMTRYVAAGDVDWIEGKGTTPSSTSGREPTWSARRSPRWTRSSTRRVRPGAPLGHRRAGPGAGAAQPGRRRVSGGAGGRDPGADEPAVPRPAAVRQEGGEDGEDAAKLATVIPSAVPLSPLSPGPRTLSARA